MHETKIEVIKLGINFDLTAEIEARAKKPIALTDSGTNELKAAMASKKKEDAKKAESDAKAKAKADAEAAEIARCEKAILLLEQNSSQSKPTSSSDLLLAAGGLADGEFKSLLTKTKRLLKDRGFEITKSTRKGVVYYALAKF